MRESFTEYNSDNTPKGKIQHVINYCTENQIDLAVIIETGKAMYEEIDKISKSSKFD